MNDGTNSKRHEDGAEPDPAMQMATEIVIAYLKQSTVEPLMLPELIRQVRSALGGSGDQPPPPATDAGPGRRMEHSPKISIEDSIQPEYLISFEDGRPYRTLRRHLKAKYGLTPAQYREKWGLPSDYPMVAPSYSADRAKIAKRTGLGKRSTGNKGTKAARAANAGEKSD